MGKLTTANISHRVTLHSLSTAIGDGGQKSEIYSPIATVWAAISPSHHAPLFKGNKTEFPVSHEITIRYSSAYESARRITFGARAFQVRSKINVGEKRQLLVFKCEERLSA